MPHNTLQRKLGLFQATVLNMIDMVGIGPFVTLPIVIGLLGGMYIYAWIAGAILSLIDALIWSELGAAYPQAGGSYNFLKHAYKKQGLGKLMSFLYVWQTVIQAPLVAASAAIGFAHYFGYLMPLQVWQTKALSGLVIVIVTVLLYRKIDNVGKLGILLWVGVILTLGWIIVSALLYGDVTKSIGSMSTFNWNTIASFAFGQACVKTIYSYLGYYNVCHLGGEIKQPQRNIPRSMFISVIGIAILYLAMNVSITSVVPWQSIQADYIAEKDTFIISTFFENLYGIKVAKVATVMVLWVALASLFAVMLGYSRVPYAAAVDGAFFKVFAKLHPTKHFPYISLLILAGIAFVFSLLFKMKDVISGILAMRILVQFIGQAIGVLLLSKNEGRKHLPFKMPLYPLPILLAIILWSFVFYATGTTVIISFSIIFGSGLLFYFINNRLTKKMF